MSDSTNNGKGWDAAIGAALGAIVGENGFLGGNKGGDAPASMDQLQAGINALRSEGQAGFNAIRSEGQAAALSAQIAGVKDAIAVSSGATQLALCGLGHNMQHGFASVNQAIAAQGAASRELALQQALDAERTRATELRIALSEHKNQAGHASTQVLVNQLISGNA